MKERKRNDYHSNMMYDPYYLNNTDFRNHVEKELKRSFTDLIFSELEKGDKIIHLGKVCTRKVLELNLIESRLDITIDDFVMCKDCQCNMDGFCYVHEFVTKDDGYCNFAERKRNE